MDQSLDSSGSFWLDGTSKGSYWVSGLIWQFLHDQTYLNASIPSSHIDIFKCLQFYSCIYVVYSVIAIFYSLSDLSGIQGMH